VGGRASFNVRSNVQIEAGMAYDFKRNFTTTFCNGVSTELVSTGLRTLHALFGPKFGTSGGPVRLFGTFNGAPSVYASMPETRFISRTGLTTTCG
jgi:hypothetical protein